MNGILYTGFGELTIGDTEVTISSVQIIGPGGTNQVLQGDQNIVARLTLLNSGVPLTIDPLPRTILNFKDPDTGLEQPVLALQRTDGQTILPTNVPTELIFTFNLQANYPVGQVDVYATVSFDDGNLIKAPVEPSGTFEVLSGGDASYVDNSLTPNIIVPRQTVGFKATFTNSGTSDIVLDPEETYLEILNSSAGQVPLVGQYTLVGNSSTTISYENVLIPANLTPGLYSIRFVLTGRLLNGNLYNKSMSFGSELSVIRQAQVFFSNINIPAETVRQGQTDVRVDYTLQNTGASDARVTSINYRFKQGEIVLPVGDWIASDVTPALPVTVATGAQQTITVKFNISNIAQLGTVQPQPIVSYNDIRTPGITDVSETVVLNDQVVVIRPASVRIESFDIVKNVQAPNAPLVNENQSFTLQVVVRNTGDDLIEQVNIDIFRNAGQDPVLQLDMIDIAPQMTQSKTFNQSFPNAGNLNFQARIESAFDAIGNPAMIGQSIDNLVDVIVQRASNLSLDMNLSSGPVQTDSLIISEGQQFTAGVRITNSGESQFKEDGNGRLSLVYDQDIFRLVNEEDSIQTFTYSDTLVHWDFTTVAKTPPDSFRTIGFIFEQVPIDKNTGNPVPLSVIDDAVNVQVQESGKVLKNELVMLSPLGCSRWHNFDRTAVPYPGRNHFQQHHLSGRPPGIFEFTGRF